MTIQLLFISIAYLAFALLLTIINLLYLCDLLGDHSIHSREYASFFSYCILLFCSIASALLLSRVRH